MKTQVQQQAPLWRVGLVVLSLLVFGVVGALVLKQAQNADCWLYCESKAPPKAFTKLVGAVAKFSADHGIPVRTINALGAKLLGSSYIPGSTTYTASGNHVCAAGATVATIELVGGGGGASGAEGGVAFDPGPGGGAGYTSDSIACEPYTTVSFTVGAAGAGHYPAAGDNGGTTSSGSLSATGGVGGSGVGGAPGVPGTGGSGSGGSVNRTGGAGTPAGVIGASGAGGGAGGPSGNGSAGSGTTGGASGGAPGGNGGNRTVAGSQCGGGGGADHGSDGLPGKAGAVGCVKFTW